MWFGDRYWSYGVTGAGAQNQSANHIAQISQAVTEIHLYFQDGGHANVVFGFGVVILFVCPSVCHTPAL